MRRALLAEQCKVGTPPHAPEGCVYGALGSRRVRIAALCVLVHLPAETNHDSLPASRCHVMNGHRHKHGASHTRQRESDEQR